MNINRFNQILDEELGEALNPIKGYEGGLTKEVVISIVKKKIEDAIDINDIEDEIKKELSGTEAEKAINMAEHIKMLLKNTLSKL